VPGFDEAKKLLTVQLARIMLASPVFFGLSYIFGAILNSFKRFLVYSLTPLVYNVSIILGTILFADRIGIFGVALAVVAGAFLHLVIQIPVAVSLGWRWQSILNFKNSAVRKIGILMFPRAIGLGANQIMLLVFTGLASAIGGSAVAVYNLADNIQTMPMVVFGTSFAMAIFPTLAEKYADGDMESFTTYFTKTLRSILFFMVPIVFGVVLLRAQIVRLILGSGHFGWQQTIDTANTLSFFAVALVFTSTIPLLARAFYGLHNTKVPMLVTIVTVILSIIAGWLLAPSMGIRGLALAYSIGSFFNSIILYWLLRSKFKIEEGSLLIFLIKVVMASLIMAVAIQEIKFLAALFVDMHRFWGVFTQTTLAIGGGIIIYLLIAWIFNCEEIASIKVVWARVSGRSLADETREPGE
jgi:putative peptidoglycan lipid II flippase